MLISVGICTWNRADLLDQTLSEMGKLVIPAGIEWELLVVNNNCTDDTDDVLSCHAKKLPLRRQFEAKQGHSHARNCAVRAARGELLIWTDDDVLVDANWLAAYVTAADKYPEANYFGGKIVPWWTFTKPSWFDANAKLMAGILVLRDLGETERIFERNETPFGANMGFRRSAFERHSFDPNLGRVAHGMVGGDDTEYVLTMQRAGEVGVWLPGAVVNHYVVPSRLTARHIWRYYTGKGQMSVRLDGVPDGNRLFGVPRWLLRKQVSSSLVFGSRVLSLSDNWVASLAVAARCWGMICESRARAAIGAVKGNTLTFHDN